MAIIEPIMSLIRQNTETFGACRTHLIRDFLPGCTLHVLHDIHHRVAGTGTQVDRHTAGAGVSQLKTNTIITRNGMATDETDDCITVAETRSKGISNGNKMCALRCVKRRARINENDLGIMRVMLRRINLVLSRADERLGTPLKCGGFAADYLQ